MSTRWSSVRVGGRLFGRHVARRAERHAGGGQPLGVAARDAARVAHGLGHAEVGDERVPPAQHDVVGLDVAVHHALRVRVGQRLDDLLEQPDRLGHRQLALAREPLPQRLALDVGHDVVEAAAASPESCTGRMWGCWSWAAKRISRSNRSGPSEAASSRMEDLQRDAAVMLDVVRGVDRRHAAAPELALEHVPVAQGFGEITRWLGNVTPPAGGSEHGI